MKATVRNSGYLNYLDKCLIVIPIPSQARDIPISIGEGGGVIRQNNAQTIVLRILPEISDTKSATYADEVVIGRSAPIKTYSHSENRTINMKAHFVTLTQSDVLVNLYSLRLLQSAVYPAAVTKTSPYLPPPICKIKCGRILAGGDGFLCVVLKSYSVSYPTDVIWDETTYLPYKFDVDLTWEVVYSNDTLPGQDQILMDL